MRGKAQNPKPESTQASSDHIVELAAGLVSSFLSRNHVALADVPALIGNVHNALTELANQAPGGSSVELKPAVPVKKSVSDAFIICLEDGKKLSMLKRYLRAQYNLSPEEYRKKWGLPHDYPMVAPAYARLRSAFAKKIGLGRTPSRKSGGRRRATRPT